MRVRGKKGVVGGGKLLGEIKRIIACVGKFIFYGRKSKSVIYSTLFLFPLKLEFCFDFFS